jgi:predicted CXXCH cytochrome family protein
VGGRAGTRIALIAVALAAAAWGGCSAEKHYQLLSFFFDGVPEPGGGPGAAGPIQAGPGAIGVLAVVSSHPDYVDGRCQECHGESAALGLAVNWFSELDSTSCAACHDPALDVYPYRHGPVAANECLWCHEAHESTYPYLLVAESPDMCLACHRFELLGFPQPPEHDDLGRDCLDCHHAHGGDEKYFLKPREAWGPPAQEAESPEAPIEPKETGEADME